MNEAVEIGHRDGILTAASLMVGSPATADAVERARGLPKLAVGLHLALVEAQPVLPPEKIPDLVRPNGLLRTDMAALSAGLLLRPRMRRQMEAEIEAQFRAFAATRLVLDHVNAHKHFHINPIVSGMVLRIGHRYGMRAIRVPREPTAVLRAVEPGQKMSGIAERLLAGRLARTARSAGLQFTDRVLGLAWTGGMNADRVATLLDNLPDGSSEIYLHPAVVDDFADAVPGYCYAAEHRALRHAPAIRAMTGLRSGGYGRLAGSS